MGERPNLKWFNKLGIRICSGLFTIQLTERSKYAVKYYFQVIPWKVSPHVLKKNVIAPPENILN
jgi:hypothetical protein